MVTIDPTTLDLGRNVADAVLAFPGARGLWVRRDGAALEFWVLTEPTDDVQAERALTDVEDLFYDHVPGIDLTVHLVNPARFVPFDLATVIPPDAVRLSRLA